MPLYIFDEPSHAAIMIAFGAVFGGIATLIVYVAKKRGKVARLVRYDPVFFLIKGRPRTDEELSNAVPDFFWPLYGGVGRFFQFVGFLVVLLGVAGLTTSLFKKLM
jgi:hypothetical protein